MNKYAQKVCTIYYNINFYQIKQSVYNQIKILTTQWKEKYLLKLKITGIEI